MKATPSLSPPLLRLPTYTPYHLYHPHPPVSTPLPACVFYSPSPPYPPQHTSQLPSHTPMVMGTVFMERVDYVCILLPIVFKL